MKCRHLEGENIKPTTNKEAKALIGKRVCYLRRADIDTSGRGYIFPRYGLVVGVSGREIAMDSPDNFVASISNLVEMVEVPDAAV